MRIEHCGIVQPLVVCVVERNAEVMQRPRQQPFVRFAVGSAQRAKLFVAQVVAPLVLDRTLDGKPRAGEVSLRLHHLSQGFEDVLFQLANARALRAVRLVLLCHKMSTKVF